MSIPAPGSEPLIQFISDNDEISYANIPLKVKTGVSYELINVAGQKLRVGDPGPDDHPLDSTVTVRSNIGGGQVLYNRGDQDQNRYWDADTDCEHVEVLAAGVAYQSLTGPNTSQCVILGQYPANLNAQVYAAWGNRFCRINPSTFVVTDVAGFTTDAPLANSKATVYYASGLGPGLIMYIPCGASYHTWNGTTLSRVALSAQDFTVWEDKLIRMDASGIIWYTFDGVTWLGPWGQMMCGDTPRHLAPFYDRQNVMGVAAVSDANTYQLDFDDGILFVTDFFNPRHPRGGLGVVAWRSNLYVSAGLGISEQSNGEINPAGVDRDFSLPAELAGYVVDLAASYNYLFALIRGKTTGAGGGNPNLLRLTGQETMEGAAGNTLSSLFAWNGFGWFKFAQFAGIPSTVFVANPSDIYQVWWGADTMANVRPLSMDYYNPRETVPFALAPRSTYISSRFRFNWIDTPKILKVLEVRTRNCTATANIEVYARADSESEADWIPMGVITGDGQHTFHFGDVVWDNVPLLYGKPVEWVQLKFVFNVDPNNVFVSPNVEWFTITCRKFLRPVRTWRLQVTIDQPVKDRSQRDIVTILDTIAITPGAQPFVHNQTLYMVDMTQISGTDSPGQESNFVRTLTLRETTEVL